MVRLISYFNSSENSIGPFLKLFKYAFVTLINVPIICNRFPQAIHMLSIIGGLQFFGRNLDEFKKLICKKTLFNYLIF